MSTPTRNYTNFTANNVYYSSSGQDLVNIINQGDVLGFAQFETSGNVYPLTTSIYNLTNIYKCPGSDAGSSGPGELYIPIGNVSQMNYNDTDDIYILLMPNVGCQVWDNAGYTGTCWLEAYNNTPYLCKLEKSSSGNAKNFSSILMLRNVGAGNTGTFQSNSGTNGYTAVPGYVW